jgi:hypothetical protein
MRKKTKLLPALAFLVALVPVAEVATIAEAAHHDAAMSSVPSQHRSPVPEVTVVRDPFSISGQTVRAAGSELIMVDSTPVWVNIH